MDERYEGGEQSSGNVLKQIGILLALAFLPGVILSIIIYFILFRISKLRLSVITFILFFISLILGIFIKVFHLISLDNLIMSYITSCVMIGIMIGYIYIAYKAYQFKKHPENKSLHKWSIRFTYRKTPWQILKRKLLIKSIKNGEQNAIDRSPIGILDGPIRTGAKDNENLESKEDIVYRFYEEAITHSLVTGGTGAGKTLTILSMVKNDILAGHPVCFIDFKKSPDVIYHLSKWAKENNRPFYHFTSGKPGQYKNRFCKEQATYDPLSSGSPTSKADMMLNLRTWEGGAEVFKNRTQDILQSLFYLLDRTDHEKIPEIEWDNGGLAEFTSALEVTNLLAMIEEMSAYSQMNPLSDADSRRLKALIELHDSLTAKGSTPLRDQISELASNCRTLIMSSYGDWLAEGPSSKHINLLDIALDKDNQGPVVLFSFNPQDEPDFAKYMGSIILSDLNRVSSIKNAQGNKKYFGLYCDEFQTLDPNSVKDLLEKARSANFFITLSLQSLEQIISAAAMNGEAILNSIIDTCSNFIFHAGAASDSAERITKIIGKHEIRSPRISKENSGLFNFRKKNKVMFETKEDWIVPPYEFQQLNSPTRANKYKSTAYILNKNCLDEKYSLNSGVLARRTQVIVSDDLIEGVPDDFRKEIENAKLETFNKKPKIKTDSEHIKSTNDWEIKENDDVDNDWEIKEDKTIIRNKIENKENVLNKNKKMTSFEKIKMQNKETNIKSQTKDNNDSFKLPDL